MDMYEFGKQCQSLNNEYKRLFGYIPSQCDFSCTREEFIEALNLAIIDKKEIFYYLSSSSIEQ